MTLDLKDKRVLVVGLARSGVAAARLALGKGANVVAADRRAAEQLGSVPAALNALGARLALGPHDPQVFCDADLMVVSPGVPLSIPAIQAARKAGVHVIGEVELASLFLEGTLVGITGTNGKSTVTSLIGHLCQAAGFTTFVGGNLGRPLTEAVLHGGAFEVVVCELSSFQLETIEALRPKVACVTNLTPDHLDRYPSHEAYGAAKKRIFMNQLATDSGVVNARDPATVKMLEGERCKGHSFGFGKKTENAARWDNGQMWVLLERGEERYQVKNRALRGDHNLENAMAAVLCARLAGVPGEHIQAGLDGFPGLAHRIEHVGMVKGVEYVNDSKATNVESALVALKSFPGGLWLIAGGRGKGAPYGPMVEASRGKVKGVLTLGEDAEAIAEAYRGACEVIACGDLSGAVKEAFTRATAGDVVLLSPACASFDQFTNFEDRGERFKSLVHALIERTEGGWDGAP